MISFMDLLDATITILSLFGTFIELKAKFEMKSSRNFIHIVFNFFN